MKLCEEDKMIKKIYFVFIAIILAVVLTIGCANQSTTNNGGSGTTQIGDLAITSTAFENGGNIPLQYSHDGDEITPPLSFENVPDDAETLVLIMDDPDAPGGPWNHWIVFDIPADVTGFEEDAIIQYYVGRNSWDEVAYGGPDPPPGGNHRYYFRLYALDTTLGLADGTSREQIEVGMEGHILAQTSLMGRYGS